MTITQRPSIADRTAQTIWSGRLGTGRGTITSGSGALVDLPVTWAARTVKSGGMTSPEELAAAAHSSCFSMALALRLGDHGATAERLEVSATVSLADVDGRPTVVSSLLHVTAQVPGLKNDDFMTIVGEASDLCPISRLFAGAEITIDATLDGSGD